MRKELAFRSPMTVRRFSARRAYSLVFFLILSLCFLTACASNSGLLGGGNWQASGLGQQSIQVLAVDPNQLQHIFAGDAHHGVFASMDAGITWKAASTGLPLPLTINALTFDFSGKNLYAATSAGLYISSDAAVSWSQVKSLPDDAYSALAFDANSDKVVYLASAHAGILVSQDMGKSWTKVSGHLPSGALTSILYDPNRKELWAAFADALYRSSDTGATWQEMSNGLPVNAGINTLALGAVSSESSDLLFAGTNHGFLLSKDAGQHWTQSQTSLVNLKISAILLDAVTPSEVYASTTLGVLRSTDNGQNWNQLATGLPAGQAYAGLVQGDTNNTQIFLASHGVYRYPGSGSVADPSRLLPILLILVFFLLLYLFLARTRRRLNRRRASAPGGPVEPDTLSPGTLPHSETASEELPGENRQNGRYPPVDTVPDQPSNEQKED